MDNKSINLYPLLLRLIFAIAIAHFAYFLLISVFINNARGLEALAFFPLIIILCIGVLLLSIKKLTNLGIKTIILGVFIAVATMFLVEILFHPSIYSGDGSTLVSANLFVPTMIWDNNFEFLKIYPATYIISAVFNYILIIGSILLSKKLID